MRFFFLTGWVADGEGFLIFEYGRFFLIRKITGNGYSSGHLQTGLRVARGVVGSPFGLHTPRIGIILKILSILS